MPKMSEPCGTDRDLDDLRPQNDHPPSGPVGLCESGLPTRMAARDEESHARGCLGLSVASRDDCASTAAMVCPPVVPTFFYDLGIWIVPSCSLVDYDSHMTCPKCRSHNAKPIESWNTSGHNMTLLQVHRWVCQNPGCRHQWPRLYAVPSPTRHRRILGFTSPSGPRPAT